ncbi:MAG: amidohydrolase family protein [Syntrophobacterales bacterium]|nr:amidohydrolase family protein [Syntrophobacterales bacterium]
MVSVTLHRARHVVPVDRPVIANGAVAVARGIIREVGRFAELKHHWRGPVLDHGEVAILPCLVNAHVHLEFSALKNRVPPQSDFPAWLSATLAAADRLSPYEREGGLEMGLRELWRFGIGLVGEVSNTGLSLEALKQSGLDHHYFYECLGFHLQDDGPLARDFPIFLTEAALQDPHFSAAAHAPYSVSPALFRRVAAWNRRRGRPTAVHVAESAAEVEFLLTGRGFFRELLQARGRWRDEFRPPGVTPVAYLHSLGVLGADTLAAHCLHVTGAEVELLAREGVTVILCPRSNRHTGAGQAPFRQFRQAGLPLAVGTDSLASVEDYNLFRDLLLLHQDFPEVPGEELIALATLGGARALRFEAELGSLTPGKQAALIGVTPEAGPDFWAGLLSGGAAGRIEWLATPDEEGEA